MRATKRKSSKRNGLRSSHKTSVSLSSSMKPMKKMNRKITSFMTKKPYQSATIATVLSGLLLGLAYMKMKNRFHAYRFYRF